MTYKKQFNILSTTGIGSAKNRRYVKPEIIYSGKMEGRAAICTGGGSKHSVGLGCSAGSVTS